MSTTKCQKEVKHAEKSLKKSTKRHIPTDNQQSSPPKKKIKVQSSFVEENQDAKADIEPVSDKLADDDKQMLTDIGD